ncbi:AT-rich interactive domain-containing protein 1-like isoform X2 [Impatiens glandulifera]|nr:AT-rich interactive domain-containing protein 1-like isoform X2 [Impatiens glandulifera]
MMETDEAIDVLKLYMAVREKGGFDEVTRKELWDSVAEASGLGSHGGSTLKFIYTKYLDKLDTWLQKIGKEVKSVLDARDRDTTPSSLMDADVECEELKPLNSNKKDVVEHSEASGLNSGNVLNVNDGSDVLTDECAENVDSFVAENVDTCDNISERRKIDLENEIRMLHWVTQVAKDPCDPQIENLPDCFKWKNIGNDQKWKQILLAREAMLIKRPTHMGDEQSSTNWLKQKMHPYMYEDFGQNDGLRCSPRILSAKIASQEHKSSRLSQSALNSSSRDLDNQLDKESDSGSGGRRRRTSPEVALFNDNKKRKRVSVGTISQAVIPEWKGGRETYESDPKWISGQVWPLKNNEQNKYLIERERIGKGRQDSCGCQHPGSIDCVRFHISEKKSRVKLELCSAFDQWQFDKMGENVALSWRKEDEKKFASVIKANTPSLEKSFWTEIFKAFPKKSREELVSYYFNVFILQRRSQQNRLPSSEIDSDDDESEGPYNCFGKRTASSPGSIFSSPKKPNLNNNSR